MKFIIFFFLIITAISSNSQAQWRVSGGNLIWPYGNVEIAKDLTVNGETNLDSNVTISGDLTVDGDVNSNGVIEYIARITWNLNSDPTVTELKNTTGASFTWDNQDDLGEDVTITASSAVFTGAKTSYYHGLANAGAVNFFVYGYAEDQNHYRLRAVDGSGGQQAIPDMDFIVDIKIYP